ncbi:MAG: nitroreductase family protein [Chloroflexales bacterium]|jgi:nitroreductase
MTTKPAVTDHPIHTLLQTRWSPRAFAPTPVASDQILSLFEAARWSASGANVQPWSFVVAPRDDEEAFARLLGTLVEGNQVWAQHVPLLVLAVAHQQREPGKPNPYALYDLGQAVAHLSVQATALGLRVHQMAGFDPEQARSAFAIPEEYLPFTVLAIGTLGNPDALPEPLRTRELAERTRKPLGSFVFGGAWGQPVALSAGVAQEV